MFSSSLTALGVTLLIKFFLAWMNLVKNKELKLVLMFNKLDLPILMHWIWVFGTQCRVRSLSSSINTPVTKPWPSASLTLSRPCGPLMTPKRFLISSNYFLAFTNVLLKPMEATLTSSQGRTKNKNKNKIFWALELTSRRHWNFQSAVFIFIYFIYFHIHNII